jgi:hypothetical protein
VTTLQFNIDLGKPFDRIAFVNERDEAEKMISEGWFPIWEPNAVTLKGAQLPNVSPYFILVFDTRKRAPYLDPAALPKRLYTKGEVDIEKEKGEGEKV